MARLLALDWDSREFHLVAADVNRGKVTIEHAISWRVDEAFVPANAEQYAARFRERLKEAGIAPAPIVVGLGRDRVVVREVRYPQVSADVEALIVRNQITKDLTESPDDVFLDYAPLPDLTRNGEKRAMSLVVRKDMIHALQTIARIVGIKLLAVTARPFGIASCFKYLAGHTPQIPAPPSPDAVAGVLTVTGGWAEFCAVRGQHLLFARSMAVGDAVLSEVRRNLAAYSGQPQLTFPRDAIQALYVSGNGENALLREKLQETLGIPVYGMDPFATTERVEVESNSRAGYAGAVGLLYLWAVDQTTPVNFVKPREVKQTTSPVKRKALVYGSAAAVAAVVLLGGGFIVLGDFKAAELKKKAELVTLKKHVDDLQPELKYLEALGDWNDGAIDWIDEIYDLAARAPYEKGFRINKVVMAPSSGKATPKDKGKAKDKDKGKEKSVTAKMTIEGVVDSAKVGLIDRFMATINNDREKHVRCTEELRKKGTGGMTDFTLRIDIVRQAPTKYQQLIPR